ncbi:MAG: type IV pilus assembly protein PilM [Bacillota bacterium]|nr:type IV pilus assembly protein PilM [Bacillota bacterium]
MGLFGSSGIVGLEMDTGVIRAVEMQGKNGSAKVTAAGQVTIPDSAVVDGVVQEIDTVSAALVRLWADAKFGNRHVVLGMFNQGLIMRLITFPKVPREKLEQALRLQAGEYFPIPLSQMVMDFSVVGEVEQEDGMFYEVLLVAAKKLQLEQSMEVLRKSKLTPKVVDAAPLAMMRTVQKKKLEGTAVLVDLSMGMSSVLLSIDGKPRFARVMPVAFKQYWGNIAATMSQDEADTLAAVGMEAGTGDEKFRRWGASVAKEIRASVSYYVKQDNLSDVDRVILGGRGARVTGLPELLQGELGVPVELVRPLDNIKPSGKQKSERLLVGPEFGACVGLALRGLDV